MREPNGGLEATNRDHVGLSVRCSRLSMTSGGPIELRGPHLLQRPHTSLDAGKLALKTQQIG